MWDINHKLCQINQIFHYAKLYDEHFSADEINKLEQWVQKELVWYFLYKERAIFTVGLLIRLLVGGNFSFLLFTLWQLEEKFPNKQNLKLLLIKRFS